MPVAFLPCIFLRYRHMLSLFLMLQIVFLCMVNKQNEFGCRCLLFFSATAITELTLAYFSQKASLEAIQITQ